MMGVAAAAEAMNAVRYQRRRLAAGHKSMASYLAFERNVACALEVKCYAVMFCRPVACSVAGARG